MSESFSDQVGYQKWFPDHAQGLIPLFTHGPLILRMNPVFGIKCSTYYLGVSGWLVGGYCSLAAETRRWGFGHSGFNISTEVCLDPNRVREVLTQGMSGT